MVDPDRPLGYRHLRRPRRSRSIRRPGRSPGPSCPAGSCSPRTDVRPVAPFLELGADRRRPARTGDRRTCSRRTRPRIADLRWRVELANLKVFRRTMTTRPGHRGQRGHRDHDPTRWPATRTTSGRTSSIPFGSVRFIRPTAAHPESGCATSPGFVYGASRPPPPVCRTTRTCATSSTTPTAAAGWATRTPDPRGSPCLARSTRWTRRAEPRIPGRRLRRPGPRLPDRARPDPDEPSPGSASATRVRPGRAAGPQRGRRTEQARSGPGPRPGGPGWSRPRRLSGAPSRRFG